MQMMSDEATLCFEHVLALHAVTINLCLCSGDGDEETDSAHGCHPPDGFRLDHTPK